MAANSIRAEFPNFPDRQLIRFKFFEAIIRLALDKYYKTKIASSHLEAFRLCFENHYTPGWQHFDCHKIRRERYWREENDIVLKRLDGIIKALYTQNSGKYCNSKANVYMAIDEFCPMIETADCFSD